MSGNVNLHCQQYDRDFLIVDREDEYTVISIFSDYSRVISSVKLKGEQVKYLIDLLNKEIE